MKKEFDRTLGIDFIQSIPKNPGVYLFRNKDSRVIYIGKAKDLRNRLSQYRGTTRKKTHRKMRLIIKEASSVEFKICTSEKEALLLENQLIQNYQPEFNVAGAYSFLYPCLGIARSYKHPKWMGICYTTNPDAFLDSPFELFGAYRSREIVSEAYRSLNALINFFAHKDFREKKLFSDISYSSVFIYRQIDQMLQEKLITLFRGESEDGLGILVDILLENPNARKDASEIQSHLKNIKYFFRKEAQKLRLIMNKMKLTHSFTPQNERDKLFIQCQD